MITCETAAAADKPARCGQCHTCLEGVMSTVLPGWPVTATRMVVCVTCGNKRCPHATDCRLSCTGSNEVGQTGSCYAEALRP